MIQDFVVLRTSRVGTNHVSTPRAEFFTETKVNRMMGGGVTQPVE